MTHYDRLRRKRLGDILVDEGLVEQEEVISALHDAQGTGRLLSDILLHGQMVNEYELARVIVEQYQAPFIDLRSYQIHKDLIAEFPAELLNAAKIVPLDRFGQQMCFACQEIPSEEHAEQLRQFAPDGIYFYVTSAVEIRSCLNDWAPVEDEGISEVPVITSAPIPIADMAEDDSWTSLFDEADADVKGGLGDE